MTDSDKKPEPLTPAEPTPVRLPEHVQPASGVPDWVESMTSAAPEPALTPSVAADAFAGSALTPPAAPVPPVNEPVVSDPFVGATPASETFTVRPEPTVAPEGVGDPSLRHQYAAPPAPSQTVFTPAPLTGTTSTDSKKMVAGILGILLGSLGVHKFYLGIQQPAIIMLCVTLGCWLLTVVTFGIAGLITIPVLIAAGVIGLVEGIIYLTKTDAQFRQEYEIGKKPWF